MAYSGFRKESGPPIGGGGGGGAPNRISAKDPSEEFVAKSGKRRKFGDEMVEVIEGSDRA